MKTKFENFDFFKDQNPDNDKPFIFAIRDRESKDQERFILTGLSEEEAKRVYKCLKHYFVGL